jgi:hypothetical protein
MGILIEASQHAGSSRTQQIWDLLSELYAANTSLSELSDDRRKSQAANLVVNAWNARQSKPTSDGIWSKPDFVTKLEAQLAQAGKGHPQNTSTVAEHQDISEGGVDAANPKILPAEQDIGGLLDLDLQDIDWDFWSSID